MVRQGQTGSSEPPGRRRGRSLPGRLVYVIGALLALEAVALGLLAAEDVQARERQLLTQLTGEAEVLGERLDGQAARVQSVIALGQRSGAGRGLVNGELAGIDAILTLRDAASSPLGSRIKTAADAAVGAMAREERMAVTANGDVVFVVEQAGFPPIIAFTRGETWLPAPRGAARFTLAGDTRIGVGSAALAGAAASAGTMRAGVQSGSGMERAATACARLAGGGLSACVTRAAPMFTAVDALRLATYALLLAAPLLAILGLINMVSRSRAEMADESERAASAQSQLDLVMSGARTGSWSWDPDTGSAEISPMAAELIGVDGPGTYRSADLVHAAADGEREKLASALEASADTGWLHVTFATRISSGREFVELRASQPDDADAPTALSGIVMDVTEQRRSDLRLRTAERRLRNAIEGFSGPFALWDQKHRLLYWNRSFAVTFNLEGTLRPGIGHDTVQLAQAGAIRQEKLSIEDGQGALIELHSGRWLKVVERATAENGYITLALDVTDNVRNEEQLARQQRKLKTLVSELERAEGQAADLARRYQEEKAKAEHAANTKSAFLANMSHELRTPLNAINGFSEILSEELYGPLGDERYKEYASAILESGQHLLDLINDILDMAKIEAGKMTVDLQPVDPVDPVDAAVRMIRRKAEDKGIALKLDVPEALPQIDADHRAIRQMVLNLVANALKFTDAGGRVTVALRVKGENLVIAVTDTGIGIPRDQISRLGNPFEQVSDTRDRNFEGTGLGLALTRSFAEMHGGRMSIASEVGKGTRVSIYLPLPGTAASREVA